MAVLSLDRMRYSLRTRVFCATVVLLALSLAVAFVGFERAARAVIVNAVGSHLSARAQEVLEATARFQSERCLAVRSWAEADAMQGTLDTGDPKFAEDYLRRSIQDQGGAFVVAALIDTNHQVRAAVRAAGAEKRRGDVLERLRGRTVAVKPVVHALRGAPLSVALAPSTALDPADASGLALFVAVPIKDFVGDLVGAVVAEVPLRAMTDLVSTIAGRDASYVPMVWDGDGLVRLGAAAADPARFASLLDVTGHAAGLERHSDAHGEPILAVRTAATVNAPPWSWIARRR